MLPWQSSRWMVAGAASTGAVVLVWLCQAVGLGVPDWAARGLVLGAVALWLVVGARRVRSALDGGSRSARDALVLVGLVALSVAARFVGLDYEIVDHFHNDEGTFLATARAIQRGELLPGRFHYPHLLHYLSAFTLWLADLFPGVAAGVAGALYGVSGEAVPALLLRMTTAALSALTTLPVFLAARHVAGSAAAALAGALIALSPTYNEVSHLAISDVPGGFFAACTLLFAARLARAETLGGYLGAGIAAGLAAASKYPAGLSALAIVGVWLAWRLRRRDLNAYLLWSGAVSAATLLAVMPALWLRWESVLGGPGDFDILFGYRQYALKGWIGVTGQSNLRFYGRGLAEGFGLAALALGTTGLALLSRERRWRALVLLPYPVLHLALLLAMNVAVKRNLQPLLPALAIVLGAGLAGWLGLARRTRRSAPAAAAIALLALASPAVRTAAWDVSRTRPSTSRLAVEWITANVPQGAGFIKEAYTPDLDRRRYRWQQIRYAARLSLEEIREPAWDYLLLARNAHQRFLDPERLLKPHHEVLARRYRELLEFDLARRFAPGWLRAGPDLLLFRIEPRPRRFVTERRFTLADVAYASDPSLWPPRAAGRRPLRFTRRGQSVVFKDHFASGRYRAAVNRQPPGVRSWLYVVSRDNLEIGEFELQPDAWIELPKPAKYFLRVFLSPGGELRFLDLAGQ